MVTCCGLKNRIFSLRLILHRNCCVVRHDRQSQLLLEFFWKNPDLKSSWLHLMTVVCTSVRTVVRLWQLGIQNHGFRNEPLFQDWWNSYLVPYFTHENANLDTVFPWIIVATTILFWVEICRKFHIVVAIFLLLCCKCCDLGCDNY